MLALIIYIISNVFYLSHEAEELPLFQSTKINIGNQSDYFLDSSIYKQFDYIRINLKIESTKNIPNIPFTLYACFSNSLDFSNLSQINATSLEKDSNYDSSSRKYIFIHTYYYGLNVFNNYRYLLLRINQTEFNYAIFSHLNPEPTSAIQLIKYYYVSASGTNYIYLRNDFKYENYIYFSFSFDNINNINLSEYSIYYTLENSIGNKSFQKSSNNYKSINSKINGTKYTFYYNLSLYDKTKKYICLKPGIETKENEFITISNLKGLPYELEKYKNITTYTHYYIYTNISDDPIGNELNYKIITLNNAINNIEIKYKFSDENFYEDYTDMKSVTPINKEIENEYDILYYHFTKKNNMNFLLIEISNWNHYGMIIIHAKVYEYEYESMSESEIILYSIIFAILCLPIIITILYIYIRKRCLQRNNNLLENNIDQENNDNKNSVDSKEENHEESLSIDSGNEPYDTQITKSIN